MFKLLMNFMAVCSVCIVCFLLSGCSGHPNSNSSTITGNTQNSSIPNTKANSNSNQNLVDGDASEINAQEQYDIIIKAFMSKDVLAIKNVFCDKVKQTHNLDEEISTAIRFINGNIVSYKAKKNVGINGASVEDGVYVDIYAEPWIDDVKTNTGESYRIYFFSRLKYPDAPDEVGVQEIEILNLNGDSYTIGEYFESNYGV